MSDDLIQRLRAAKTTTVFSEQVWSLLNDAADALERLSEDYDATCKMVADMHSAAMGARVGPALGLVEDVAAMRAERDALRADAERYRWLRDRNDWYFEPRIDEADGTKWELVFYTSQRVEDPSDDDNLDAAVDAARGGEKQ